MTLPTDHALLLAILRFEGGLHAPTLLPGQKPQAAPAPLPELAGLLGSIETPAEGNCSLYFLPLPATEGDDFVRRSNAELRALGWREAQMTPQAFRPSGFQASDKVTFPEREMTSPDPCMILLHDAGRVAACWDTRYDERGNAFLRLNLHMHGYRHWADDPEDPLPILPPLNTPDGWTLEVIGGGGGGNQRAANAQSLALLRGSGTTNDLYAHFAGLLDNLGWAEQNTTGTAALTTSSWLTPDGDFALLTLARREPGVWQAVLEVSRLNNSGEMKSGKSWFSF